MWRTVRCRAATWAACSELIAAAILFRKEHPMDAKTLKDAKADLERLMDDAVENHEPVIITRDGKPPVVLVSLADWNSQQETDYLLRSPANRESLEKSRQQIERGEVVVKTIDELEALARETSANAAE
jgi:antitoxin YefM